MPFKDPEKRRQYINEYRRKRTVEFHKIGLSSRGKPLITPLDLAVIGKTMEIFFSSKLKLPNELGFKRFVQDMANRIMQGHARYGPPDASKRYMRRIEMELRAYKSSGNAEHLINIANYCHLESVAPEHPKFHLDNLVGSVTRGKV